MPIIFQPYIAGEGYGDSPMPFNARGTDRMGNFGLAGMPFAATGSGSQVLGGSAALKMPFAAFGADVNNFGRASLPLSSFGFSSAVQAPQVTLGIITMPIVATGAGHAIAGGTGATMIPLNVFGADVEAFGRATISIRSYGRDVAPSRFATLYQFPWLESNGHADVQLPAGTLARTVHDEFLIVPSLLLARLSMQLRTVIALDDSSPQMAELIKRLDDRIGLRAVIAAAMRVRAIDTFGLTDTITRADLMALALSDAIGLVSHPSWTAESDRLLATIFALLDRSDGAQLEQLSSTLGLDDALSNEILIYARALTELRISALLTGDLLLTAVLSDTVGLGDALTSVAEMLKALASAIGISATLQLADGAYTAWVMNAESKAVWTYDNYPFNSFAQLGDRYYGAGPDGLSELVGEDDAGTAIDWSARTGVQNFGTQLEKRGVMAYLGYTSAGDVGLSVIISEPDGEKVQYNYHMIPRNAADTTVNRIEIGKGLKSVYWQFEFVGTGAFTLDSASVLPMILSRRI